MTRVALKIVGAQGQGVNSVGEMCARGLKRAGYCVFGYREYMSIIKGGHSSYQLDVAAEEVRSTVRGVDILVSFNHHGLEENLFEVKHGGIVLHQTGDWEPSTEHVAFLQRRGIAVFHLPVQEVLYRLDAKPILANVLIASVVWGLLGRRQTEVEALVKEQFGHKKDLLAANMKCIDEGFSYLSSHPKKTSVTLPKPKASWGSHLLVTGSQAMGLGIVHAGCRLYAGYPMTPSSPLLSFIADTQNETGIVVKQAEDEITAAQIMSGAMFAGTRAITATSGGGFDLMSETVSLNGIIENPSVFVLAQRPGPGTGLPTWTAQGDLLLAVCAGHGEFPRIVLSVSDSQDCFDLLPEAFNLAEEYQTPVIVLTDKQIAEALFTQAPFNQKRAKVRRGRLVTKSADLKKLTSADRFDPKARDGVSPRWLPGSNAATYCAQGDEHSPDGSVDESAANAHAQMEKRMKKQKAIAARLPEPELWSVVRGKASIVKDPSTLDLLIVGWGSTKGIVLDSIEELARSSKLEARNCAYLHYTYLWPLHTKRFALLAKKAKRVVLVEQNHTGQLGMLLRQSSGIEIADRILGFDGRPFFLEDFTKRLTTFLPKR